MPLDIRESLATIGTADLARAVAFYSGLFGREPDDLIPNVYAVFRLAGLHLGIFRPRAGEDEFETTTGSRAALSLVFRVPDLDQAAAEIRALGGTTPHPSFWTSHGPERYAYDADGNRIILVGLS